MSKRKIEEVDKKEEPIEDDIESEEEEEEEEDDYESDDGDKKAKPKKPTAKKSKKPAAPRKVAKPTLKNVLTHPQLITMVTTFIEVKHPELKDEFIILKSFLL